MCGDHFGAVVLGVVSAGVAKLTTLFKTSVDLSEVALPQGFLRASSFCTAAGMSKQNGRLGIDCLNNYGHMSSLTSDDDWDNGVLVFAVASA